MNKKQLNRINISSFLLLMIGFITSILIPKLALNAIGVSGYSAYAVLLGIFLIPAFCELGITPGFTREISTLYTEKKYRELNAFTNKMRLYLGCLAVITTFITIIIVSKTDLGYMSFFSKILVTISGCGANIIVLITEIGIIRLKIHGKVVEANFARMNYYLFFFAAVLLLFSVKQLSIPSIFHAQFVGTLVYLVWSIILFHRLFPEHHSAKLASVRIPWKRLAIAAGPEQLTKAKSTLLPGIERTMMLNYGGNLTVNAYDISIRLASIVTALPAAIASPLVALLSPNVAAGDHKKNSWILKHIEKITISIVAFGFFGVLIGSYFFGIKFYRLEDSPFIAFLFLILLGNSVNVLTATSSAFFYAHRMFLPLYLKNAFDFFVALVSLVIFIITKNALLYIAIRYIEVIFSASAMLVYYWTTKKKYE